MKKGISAVVSSIILIVLVLVTITIVWTVINKIIKEETKTAKSCFDIIDKVYLNNEYTCYNSGSKELRFYIGIKDLEVDNILVSIKGSTASKSFEIPEKAENIKMHDNSSAVLPEKNSGLLYVASDLDIGKINTIEIAPIIDKEQCQISDSITQIDDCLSMA